MSGISDGGGYYVLVDNGGTYVKSAILSTAGDIVPGSYSVVEIDSLGSRESLLSTLLRILQKQIARAVKYGVLSGIAMSFPGPFDYENGISRMDHKYQGILGVDLRSEIAIRLKLPREFPVLFEEDSVAFLRGEVDAGGLEGFDNIIGITLGTGLGSAFMATGRIVRSGPSIPVSGELWNVRDGSGILEDWISSRAIRKLYRDIARLPENHHSEPEVRQIASMASSGDVDSIEAFREFGRLMGEKLKYHAEKFKAECLVVGGQIAKSFELFSGPLRNEMSSVPTMKKIVQAKEIQNGVFYGLLKCFE